MFNCDNCGKPNATFPFIAQADFGTYKIGLPCMLCQDCFQRLEEIHDDLARKRKAIVEAGPITKL